MNNLNTENDVREIVTTDTQESKMRFKKPDKKAVRRILLGAMLIAILGGGVAIVAERVEAGQEAKAVQAAYTIASNQAAVAGTTVISIDEAKQIAFNAAGVTEADVKFLQTEFDVDDDRYYRDNRAIATYDIEFRHGILEYNFEIDAETGAVLSYEVE